MNPVWINIDLTRLHSSNQHFHILRRKQRYRKRTWGTEHQHQRWALGKLSLVWKAKLSDW